jgi:hypothetical protein
MDDLVARAEQYAIGAHGRIDQRRKYTNQSYDAHLKAVVDILGEVTDNSEVLAAAWLHDTLEDTPATYDDIEKAFGTEVADLVTELTEVSRASDGNRAVRKAIDRAHLARASANAKTIKLADLIDNCRDIVRHDPKFGRVFVTEAAALLEVRDDGDPVLYARAEKLVRKSAEKLKVPVVAEAGLWAEPGPALGDTEPFYAKQRVGRLFIDCFRATDIAEPLPSFDSLRDPQDIARILQENKQSVAGIRRDGHVAGYVRLTDISAEDETAMRGFAQDQVVTGDASLTDVIHVLTRYNQCFVTLLGEIVGVISRADVQKPLVRMWLFGIVTLAELEVTEQVRARFPSDSWQERMTESRLSKARTLWEERQRRGLNCDLLDCLQLTDKVQVLFHDPNALAYFGFKTRRSAKQVLRELESLRNHLAHAQDIVTHDWPQIVRLVRRIEELSGPEF